MSHSLIETYGILGACEMEVATSRSEIPEVNVALRETEKHLQAAQASLKTALTFKPKTED